MRPLPPFDRIVHDAEADVLYLAVSGVAPAHWEETPEGHVARFDAEGNICGVTLIGISRHMDEGGQFTITVTVPRH